MHTTAIITQMMYATLYFLICFSNLFNTILLAGSTYSGYYDGILIPFMKSSSSMLYIFVYIYLF